MYNLPAFVDTVFFNEGEGELIIATRGKLRWILTLDIGVIRVTVRTRYKWERATIIEYIATADFMRLLKNRFNEAVDDFGFFLETRLYEDEYDRQSAFMKRYIEKQLKRMQTRGTL